MIVLPKKDVPGLLITSLDMLKDFDWEQEEVNFMVSVKPIIALNLLYYIIPALHLSVYVLLVRTHLNVERADN